jgi:hypothetical protein
MDDKGCLSPEYELCRNNWLSDVKPNVISLGLNISTITPPKACDLKSNGIYSEKCSKEIQTDSKLRTCGLFKSSNVYENQMNLRANICWNILLPKDFIKTITN